MDAISNVAVGCCLIQWSDDNSENPIAFASAKLNHTLSKGKILFRLFALRMFRKFFFEVEFQRLD